MTVKAFDLTKIPHKRFKFKDVTVCEAIVPIKAGNFKLVWRRATLAAAVIEVDGQPKANPLVNKNFNVERGAKVAEIQARQAVAIEFARVWELT